MAGYSGVMFRVGSSGMKAGREGCEGVGEGERRLGEPYAGDLKKSY